MGNKKRRNARAVATLRERVVLHREAGLSFSEIAKLLGISKTYAVRLALTHRADMRRAGAGHIALTARQHRFARALINGRSPQVAAAYAARPKTLFPAEAQRWADKTMADEGFQLAIRQIFGPDGPKAASTPEEHHADPGTVSQSSAARPTPPPARPSEDEIEWEEAGYIAVGEFPD